MPLMLTSADYATLAVASGRMPDGIDPDSPLGQSYVRRIQAVDDLREHFPPMTDALIEELVAILRTSETS